MPEASRPSLLPPSTVSLPAPKTKVSAPLPPLTLSLPAPASTKFTKVDDAKSIVSARLVPVV
ncbi:MAG: hypothetical protein EBT05_10800 [Betaproteobacteria bacterium]|nr:hypothetical protein [Betaproteobacteria bacterium]